MPELLKKAGAGHPRVEGELVVRVVNGERDEDIGKVVSQEGVHQW